MKNNNKEQIIAVYKVEEDGNVSYTFDVSCTAEEILTAITEMIQTLYANSDKDVYNFVMDIVFKYAQWLEKNYKQGDKEILSQNLFSIFLEKELNGKDK